jgi:hypothetical protein
VVDLGTRSGGAMRRAHGVAARRAGSAGWRRDEKGPWGGGMISRARGGGDVMSRARGAVA